MTEKVTYINLFHLKSINGMAYYALDYLPERNYRILYNSKNKAIETLFSESQTALKLNLISYFIFFLRSLLFRFSIFTPTPHPLPFLSKQVVVFHDSYPFRIGRLSYFKRLLFGLSLKSSKAKVGFINFADAKAFLKDLPLPEDRCLFMPNKLPDAPLRNHQHQRVPGDILRIGAVGTDSPKKNHELLLSYLQRLSVNSEVKLYLFGQENLYVDSLRSEFSSFNFEVIDSNTVTLATFLEKIDLVASTAKGEGFCRPVAMALQMGIPCLLINDPVFKEFYTNKATFFKGFDQFEMGFSRIFNGNSPLPPFCSKTLNSQFSTAKRNLTRFLE